MIGEEGYLQASKVYRLTSSVEDEPKSKRAGAEGRRLLSLFLLLVVLVGIILTPALAETFSI